MAYRLKKMKNGAWCVHDTAYGETMHPGGGPWMEANRLYVDGGGLPALLARGAGGRAAGRVVVFDVGLGAAANALAAVKCHQQRLRDGQAVLPMLLVSFENEPSGAEFAMENAAALEYPAGYEEVLDQLLERGGVELPGGLRWELRLGNFTQLVAEEPARADLIFFDPFSPASNPEMWSLSSLEDLYRCRRPGAETRLVTYSSAFGVRAGLLAAGFFVGEGPRSGERGATTLATTAFSGLDDPLTPAWLARWRKNPQPWPPLTPPEQRPKLRKALLEHPQWGSGVSSHSPTMGTPGKPKWGSGGSSLSPTKGTPGKPRRKRPPDRKRRG